MICPLAADSSSIPVPRPPSRDGRMTASVSSSVSLKVPCRGTSPASVTKRASYPSPAMCTPTDAAAMTASSNIGPA